MRFDAPVVLVLGLLVAAALAVAAVVVQRRRAEALAAAGSTARVPRGPLLGVWATVAGLVLLAVAAAGPVAAVPVPRSSGTVIVAIDVSGSMAAEDVSPNRLAAAKRAASAFVEAQPANVDVGVVAFEQGALTTAKPAPDHAVALAAIKRLKVSGGTSLSAAVLASLTAITGKPVRLGPQGQVPAIGDWPSATVVVFSDGGDDGPPATRTAAATTAQNAGVHIDTVGVGTAAGTTVEADGFQVRTALDTGTLQALSRTTGGAYHPASDAAALDGVASSIDLRLTVADQDLPLAGGVTAVALLLLVAGAALTVLRTGRLI